MTGYTVHTGASKKFVSGWDRVFGEPGEKPNPDVKGASKARGKSAAKGKKAKKK